MDDIPALIYHDLVAYLGGEEGAIPHHPLARAYQSALQTAIDLREAMGNPIPPLSLAAELFNREEEVLRSLRHISRLRHACRLALHHVPPGTLPPSVTDALTSALS